VPPDDELAAFVADLPVSRRAAALAADVHAAQERQVDGAPFVVHPFEVALLVHGAGYRDEVVAIALLHDVLEKTGVTPADLRDAFGAEVAAGVAALSEDGDIADYGARKAEMRDRAEAAADDIVAVFGADKVVKARELRLAAAADRLSARDVACRREHYMGSLGVLERRLPGHPFTDALRFELAAQLHVPALAWLRPAERPVPVGS
jgi:guanosine-3',5'-bis(diphosphate) 3'-pyrophosphohydrolase